MKLKISLVVLSLLCSYTSQGSNTQTHPLKPATQPKDTIYLDWINKNIAPGDDFYSYANGLWQKNNPIPADQASWGSFNILHEKVQKQLQEMLITAANDSKAKPGSIEQKVGDFYYSGMNETEINNLGLKPLEPYLERIAAIKSLEDLQKALAYFHKINVNAFFNLSSMQDFKDSTLMIASVEQAGLGLPNRDYYLKEDEKFKKIREAYIQYMTNLFELLGDSKEQALKNAHTVMAIEMQLAKASLSSVQLREPEAVYHIKTIKELDTLNPNFSWSQYLKERNLGNLKQINFATPEFFKEVNKLLKEMPLEDLKTYLRMHFIQNYATYLSAPFVEKCFKMYQALTGTEKIQPRWKRVVRTENQALGFAIGQLYIKHYFSSQDKEKVLEILKNIRKVLKEDLKTLSWMSEKTRKEALKKLDKMEERVGYPSKWWDYSKLKIDRGPYVLNVIRANEFLNQRDLNKIGKPIDRNEWEMTPQTINAYYDVSMNNLNIPAGLLQPPFFNPNAPDAVNYGSIGFVMAHEMTHGFDDQGAKFDEDGNLKNWWSEADLKQFNKATQCIVDQFSSYKVADGLPLQGKLVVGEATADLGGITLAYRAFLQSKDYKKAKTIEGLSPEQQFFLGVAHIWAMNIRPEQIRNQVTTDPHPPAKFRVNGSLANMPEFQKAFGLSENSPMINKNRCIIW